MSIGRFSQACRLSIKALRHYDELGLLRPVLVDPDSGYRYYAPSQARQAETIRILRAVEMPLPEIRETLVATEPEAARQLLAAHRERIQQRIADYQQTLTLLSSMMSKQESATSFTFTTREVAPQRILCIRRDMTRSQFTTLIPRDMDAVFGELRRLQIVHVGPPVVVYYSLDSTEDDDADDRYTIETGLPVARLIEAGEGFTTSATPGGLVAATTLFGPYDGISDAYVELAKWVQENGYEGAGPAFDVYITDPQDVPNPKDYQTEIVWPVRRVS